MKVLSTAATISQAFKNAGRVSEILGVFARHGFADLVNRMELQRFLPSRITANPRFEEIPTPVRLRMAFEELGPSFVKLGQLLAARPDLIPESFVDEFARLQDNVASVPFPEIKRWVEGELGASLETYFEVFEETPLAAASIGQVHGGVLKTGERVAVKVQRPGIERLVMSDISILRGLAVLLERYVPESRTVNPVGLVEEFFRTILFELDFRVEANNIRRIRKNLAVIPKVAIPEVYGATSTGRVLTLERFEGVRFADREAIIAQGIDPMEIVGIGADTFFHMVMHDGLFHADLHSGNLFILPDGRIGFIDFGIVGRLSRRTQDSIITMFVAIVDEDYETLANEYCHLCHATGMTDMNLLQKDLMDAISPYVGMALGEVNVGQLLLRSTAIAVRHHLQVPRELMLLFKAIYTIEALGKKLEPSFDILQVGTKLARQVITTRYSKDRVLQDLIIIGRDLQGLAETVPRLLRRYARVWTQNNFAIETRNRDVGRLADSLRELTYGFLLATLALGLFAVGIAIFVTNAGPQILGLPFWGFVATSTASWVLLHGLWRIRRRERL